MRTTLGWISLSSGILLLAATLLLGFFGAFIFALAGGGSEGHMKNEAERQSSMAFCGYTLLIMFLGAASLFAVGLALLSVKKRAGGGPGRGPRREAGVGAVGRGAAPGRDRPPAPPGIEPDPRPRPGS